MTAQLRPLYGRLPAGFAILMVASALLTTLAASPTSLQLPPAFAGAGPHEPLAAYAEQPLSFAANEGQADARFRYFAQAGSLSAAFAPGEVLLGFSEGEKGTALALRFVGGDRGAAIEARRALPGKVNYFVGSDRTQWRRNIPTYGEIVYRVDLPDHTRRL